MARVIPQEELNALMQVQHALRSNTLPGQFNMTCSMLESDCGSIGCIGGWMGYYMGMSRQQAQTFVADQMGNDGPYYPLFYPKHPDWRKITPEQAVIAIDNFIDGRDDPWDFLSE